MAAVQQVAGAAMPSTDQARVLDCVDVRKPFGDVEAVRGISALATTVAVWRLRHALVP